MSKLFPASWSVALLVLAIEPSAMQLNENDTYLWQRRDMSTLAVGTLRVTILDKRIPTGLYADSGSIRRILHQTEAARPETLQLFEFHDGDLRWWTASRWFPVEFQSPQSVINLRSGRMKWGQGVCNSFGCSDFPEFETTRGNFTKLGTDLAIFKTTFATPLGYADRIDSLHGAWTDSAGPIWFHSPRLWDFVLLSKNGRSIGWTSPHIDSMEMRAQARTDSILAANAIAKARYDSIVNVLKARQAAMRFPRVGDRYTWFHLSRETEIGGAADNVLENKRIEATTIEAPPDSSGWTRRTFEVMVVRDTGGIIATTVRQRWDSLGRVVSESKELGLLTSWSSDSFQVVAVDGSYSKSFSESSWPTSSSYAYLKTGELSLYRHSTPTFCTVTYPNSSQCKYYHSTLRDSVVLLSHPGGAWVATPPRHAQSRDRMDIHHLRALLATEPQATLRWSTPTGRSGNESLSSFLGSPRQAGVVWIQVTTSHGRTFQGTWMGL